MTRATNRADPLAQRAPGRNVPRSPGRNVPRSPTWNLNADLHSHSRISDGTLGAAQIVARAQEQGVQLLALTDHDHLGGLAEARAQAVRAGIEFVAGVEVSISWGGETIHVLGLRVDCTHPALVAGLERTRAGRDERAREMAESLARAGIGGAYEGALRFVTNPSMVGRTHFARYIVEQGVCEDVREVFRRYLVEGKPGFVAHRWAVLGEAVGWIRAAGGVAVLAHPARYRLDEAAMAAMIGEFREAGGTGIEVVSGSHSRDEQRRFAACAIEFGLLASRGSDFHGPGESHVELGQLPPVPAPLVPVWHDWPEALRAVAHGSSAIGA